MATEDWFVKKPCKHCPYRRDVKPFLTPERGQELAFLAENPYNSFPCHKTTESDDESEDGEMMVVESTKECAGFLSMMIYINGEQHKPEGFTLSPLTYTDAWEMVDAYEDPDNFEDH